MTKITVFWLLAVTLILLVSMMASMNTALTQAVLEFSIDFVFSAIIVLAVLVLFIVIMNTMMGIELIWVIAIIGLLSVTLLHTGAVVLQKSKVSEAMSLFGGAKTVAAIDYASRGEWSASKELQANIKTEGQYVKTIVFEQGALTSTFKDAPLNTYQLGFNLAIPQHNPLFLVSSCGTHSFNLNVIQQGQAATSLPPEYLPFVCK